MGDKVKVKKEGSVAVIEFSNPPKNFLDNVMLKEFYEELLRVKNDAGIRSIVLTGGMKDSFVTHYDVAELIEYAKTMNGLPPIVNRIMARVANRILEAANCHAFIDRLIVGSLSKRSPAERGIYFWSRCIKLLDTMPKPIIAAINGLSLGGGCEISMCCDFRFMAKGENYRIGLPEVLVGIIPGGTGTPLRLPRVVGEAKALEMLLTGKLYTPEEALGMGLVHRIMEPEELMPAAMELAQRLARGAPLAIAAIRKNVRQGGRMSFDKGSILDLAVTGTAMSSNDAITGMNAYVDQIVNGYSTLDLEPLLKDAEGLMDNRIVKYKGN